MATIASDRIEFKRGEVQQVNPWLVTGDSYWANEDSSSSWIAIDITNFTIVFVVKLDINQPDTGIKIIKINRPGEHADPINGKTSFTLSSDDTKLFPALPRPCQYPWEMWIKDASGNYSCSQTGTINVLPSVLQDIENALGS